MNSRADSPATGKVRVAVIFGGRSSEHSISCLSAASVLDAIDRDRYEVTAVGITREGSWHYVSDDADSWRRNGTALPFVPDTGPAAFLAPQAIAGSIDVDIVFPVLHGPFGEDGTIQGALELAGIPYVGSGVLASAATMDKQATKILLTSAGLPVGPYVAVGDGEWERSREKVLADVDALQWPVFVKPARAGSSIGITKVHAAADLQAAIEEARRHDRKLIIEQSVENAREIECAVLGNPGLESPQASLSAEIIVGGGHEFYDFDAKYMDGSAQLAVPADLPDAVHKEISEIAIRAFQALDCRGLARVDFFLDSAGDLVINEVNTMPGFTSISLFPRMWQHMGMSYPALIDHLLQTALAR